MRRHLLILSIAVATGICGCSVSAEQETKNDDRPNIVIILADDLGYSDVGCYGGKKAPWELYNLANDKTEVNDLAESNPEKLKELILAWEEMAQKQNVYPSPVNH